MPQRKVVIERTTKETQIRLSLDLDGRGESSLQSGIGFLDHMLNHLAKHGLMDLDIQAKGDLQVDDHHTAEDVAICLGKALAKALGDKAGIFRFGSASVPMDETLANVALDISGRGSLVFNARFVGSKIGTFDVQLVEEFLRALCREGGVCMHVNVQYGTNDHHIAEAIFKAVAQALRQAKSADPSRAGTIPSTKGTL